MRAMDGDGGYGGRRRKERRRIQLYRVQLQLFVVCRAMQYTGRRRDIALREITNSPKILGE